MRQSPILPLQLPHTRIAVAGRKNCRQDVWASKCWQRRAIDDGEREKPQRSQVAEYRGKTVPTRCGMLGEDVQHEPNISTLLGSFWEQPFLLVAAMPCDFQSDCELKKARSIEQQERLLPQNKLRSAAKSARWGG
jgi:hypothetical protein